MTVEMDSILFLYLFFLLFSIFFFPFFSFFLLLFSIPFKYFNDESYDQSIYLTCAYNSLCCYPSKYSWAKELFYRPPSSIFIKTCLKGFYNKIDKKNISM